jgi:AAA domain (dynein-related subfamily)
MKTTENSLIECMATIDPSFARSGVFSPSLVRQAAASLGVTPSWSILKKSEKIGRGSYRIELANNVVKIKTPMSETSPAPQKTEVKYEQQPAIRTNITAAVPKIDENYVPFGNYNDVKKIILSKMFFPILITGHSGNGKSTTVMQIHARANLPMIRMNMTKKTDEETLIGSKTLVNGNIVTVEGPVITAMRNGITLLIEEVDAADTNSIMCMQSILEGKPYFFSLTGEYIEPKPGFNIIMTANTKGQGSSDGRYIGTQVLNEAFLERIAFTFEQDYPSPAIEKKIVMNIMGTYNCVEEQFAEDLVKWADAIRRSFADGALDSLIATRRLEHIIRGYSLFKNKKKAIELGVNRFDSMTKQAFIDLFDKISSDLSDTSDTPTEKSIFDVPEYK